MNEEMKNVPVLRFPGFVDDWAAIPLGALYTFKSTNSFSREMLSTIGGTVRNIHYGDIHTKFQSQFDITKEQVPFIKGEIPLSRIPEDCYCKLGDVIFADASEDYSDIGKCIEVMNLGDQRVLSGLHTLLARAMTDRIQIGFASHLMKTENVRLQIKTIAQGTKVLSISSKRLAETTLVIPTLPEQQKIASFLTAVDNRIQQLSKKKALLEQYKKGVMQQLFSQKLRFKDDQGKEYPDWELRTLADICDVKGGKRLPKGYTLIEQQNGYPYITVSDMENGSVSLQNIRYIPIEAVKSIKNYRITTNDIYISVAGTLGLVGIIPEELNDANLTENANKLTNLKCNQQFLYQYLNTPYFQQLVNSVKTSNAQPKLAIYAINSFAFPAPCPDEQTKIASFLSAIDDKINSVNQQVEHTRQFKKGLLQQMFV